MITPQDIANFMGNSMMRHLKIRRAKWRQWTLADFEKEILPANVLVLFLNDAKRAQLTQAQRAVAFDTLVRDWHQFQSAWATVMGTSA